MKLLDLAKKCGVTIQEIAHSIEIQFNESLHVSASTHVPDRYVSRICMIYGASKGYVNQELNQEPRQEPRQELQQNPITITRPNPQPAKTFGDGDGKTIKLTVIAKDLNIGVQTLSDAFDYIFHGNANPNSRVTPDLAERIYSFFGEKFVAPHNYRNVNEYNPKVENPTAQMSSKTLLKFLKAAVNKKCVMATVLGHNAEKGVWFVDVLGFKSLLYDNEVKGNTFLSEEEEIEVVPTKVVGNDWPEYVLVSMKRAENVKRSEQKAILKQQQKEQRESEFNRLEINSKITGTVYEVSDKYIIVEFGLLRGIIFKNNLFWGNVCSIEHYFSPGSPIDAIVISKERDDNRFNIRLSHKDCIPNIWNQIEFDTTESGSNEVEEAEVVEIQDNGLIISLGNGFEGFLPISEISYSDYKYYIDHSEDATLIDVFVKDFNPTKKSIIFTRQPYYDKDWENIDNDFHIDEIYNGKVLRIDEDGLLVELQENIEAFVPQKELFWDKTMHDSSLFVLDSEVYILVKNIDKSRRRIIGSIREVIPDPWMICDNQFSKSQVIQVKTIGNQKDGITIETLEGGLIGKIPYSEISWIYGPKELPASAIPEIGNVLEAKIMVWNPEKRLLRLSLRQIEENPWINIAIGAKVSGTVIVKSHSEGGYIINLDCGLDAVTYEKNDEMEIGSKTDFKVVKFDKSDQIIIVSHTKLLHDEKTDILVRKFFL